MGQGQRCVLGHDFDNYVPARQMIPVLSHHSRRMCVIFVLSVIEGMGWAAPQPEPGVAAAGAGFVGVAGEDAGISQTEVAGIFRLYGVNYQRHYPLSFEQRQRMRDIQELCPHPLR